MGVDPPLEPTFGVPVGLPVAREIDPELAGRGSGRPMRAAGRESQGEQDETAQAGEHEPATLMVQAGFAYIPRRTAKLSGAALNAAKVESPEK